MKRAGIISGIVTAALAACGGGHAPLPDLSPSVIEDTTGLISRGEYLVRNLAVCGHCHAAQPQSDTDGPLSGGMAFRNWRIGTVRAANITPDSATGIGAWTEAELVRAIRGGEDRYGEILAPVMPYAWFKGMSNRDALAIARYLKSQPPVHHPVHNDHNLPYAFAELFFLKPEDTRTIAEPIAEPTAEYGRYLVMHVALCADCHTPRGGLRAAPRMNLLLAGTADPPKGFPANPANITPDTATGIGAWSERDFLETIRTGRTPNGRELHPFMPWRQFRRMRDDDLRAVYRYLRTVPPIRHEIPVAYHAPDD